MNRKKLTDKTILLIPIFVTALFFGFMMIFCQSLVDSDDAGELILSKLLSEEHGVLSPNWYYSTEIRVLNTQLIFAPLFHFFKSWKAVRCVGSTILLIIYELSAYALGRALRLGRNLSVVLAAMVVVPLSGAYFHFVMFGSYYIPHIAISFGVISLVICFCEKGKNVAGILALCGAGVLSYASCLEGPRQILCLLAPLFLSAIIIREKKLILSSTLCLVLSGAGYLTNKVITNAYGIYNVDNGISFDPSFGNLIKVIGNYLSCYGFRADRGLLSPFLVCDLAALLIAGLTILSLVRIIKNYDSISIGVKLVAVFFLSALAIYAVFITLTGYSFSTRYNMQITIYALPLILIWLKDAGKTGRRISLALAVLILFCALFTYIEYVPDKRPSEHQRMAAAVENAGASAVYSTFWNGNVMTELSDGRIEAYVWPFFEKDNSSFRVDGMRPWLQKKAHDTERPEGPVCCILDTKEMSEVPPRLTEGSELIYQSDEHAVYLFKSYGDMQELAGS